MIIWRWIFHPLWVGCVCGVGYPWQRLLFGLVLSGVCFVRRVTMATPIGRSGGSTNGAGHWHVVWHFFFFLVLLFCFPGTAGQPDPFTISWSPRCRVLEGVLLILALVAQLMDYWRGIGKLGDACVLTAHFHLLARPPATHWNSFKEARCFWFPDQSCSCRQVSRMGSARAGRTLRVVRLIMVVRSLVV